MKKLLFCTLIAIVFWSILPLSTFSASIPAGWSGDFKWESNEKIVHPKATFTLVNCFEAKDSDMCKSLLSVSRGSNFFCD